MFNKLRDKAETQKRVIDSITARINAASAKATQLKKTTKATVVVSPSSYPMSQPTHYQNLFTPLPSKPDLCSLQTPQKPKLGPVLLRPSNQEVDLSFSIMEQFPRKSQPKKGSLPVVSVDELMTFGQEKPRVKKSKKPKRKEDIDPLVWDDIMSSVYREPQDRYKPGFQNFPENSHLPDHLMSSNVATDITYEKISKDTIAPTLLWDLPPVGVDPVTPSLTPKTPQLPETPIPPSVSPPPQQTRPTADTEVRPTIPLPPPSPPQKEMVVRPAIPLPPPLPVQKTEVVPLPPGPGVSNIPPPPPPPPMVRPVPPAVPILTRRRVEPQEEDLHSQLFARILERRSAIEDNEPPLPKKTIIIMMTSGNK
jgi:hypothetical protein